MKPRARRGISLTETLVAVGLIAFWMVLFLDESQKGASWRSRELCDAGRIRLRQTLDLYRSDQGIVVDRLDRTLIDESLVVRGYLTVRPACPEAKGDEFPFSLGPEGAVLCSHHPEGREATATRRLPRDPAHRTMAALLGSLGRMADLGFRASLFLIPLYWFVSSRNRGLRMRRSRYEEASQCVEDWLEENQHLTTTREPTDLEPRKLAVTKITREGCSS